MSYDLYLYPRKGKRMPPGSACGTSASSDKGTRGFCAMDSPSAGQ